MEEISTHFFKVLIPGFHKKLNLPQSFCRKLKLEKSEWATLKSRKGTSKIKVCRNGEGLISFEIGWPQFVDEHSLSFGDFLVFQHVGRLEFNVYVFDQSACEKEFLLQPKTEKEEDPIHHHEAVKRRRIKKNKREEEVIPYNSRNPHFVITMAPYHETHADVTIPINFVRSHNLWKKRRVSLRDGRGKLWPMGVVFRTSCQFRMTMCAGWRDFYASNELKTGDVCVFYLSPSSPRSNTILFDFKIHPSV